MNKMILLGHSKVQLQETYSYKMLGKNPYSMQTFLECSTEAIQMQNQLEKARDRSGLFGSSSSIHLATSAAVDPSNSAGSG